MGRKTYEEAKKILATEKLYPEKRNIVFSSNKELILNDAEVVHEEPAKFMKNLKDHSTETVWVVGGGKLLKPLIENQLIDEWRIQITPVILGEGKNYSKKVITKNV